MLPPLERALIRPIVPCAFMFNTHDICVTAAPAAGDEWRGHQDAKIYTYGGYRFEGSGPVDEPGAFSDRARAPIKKRATRRSQLRRASLEVDVGLSLFSLPSRFYGPRHPWTPRPSPIWSPAGSYRISMLLLCSRPPPQSPRSHRTAQHLRLSMARESNDGPAPMKKTAALSATLLLEHENGGATRKRTNNARTQDTRKLFFSTAKGPDRAPNDRRVRNRPFRDTPSRGSQTKR